jgi:hypothetical protein
MPRAKKKKRFQRFRDKCLEYIEVNGPTNSNALLLCVEYGRKPGIHVLPQLLKRDERFTSRMVDSPYRMLEWHIK